MRSCWSFRHENAVLRRHTDRVRYEPGDRALVRRAGAVHPTPALGRSLSGDARDPPGLASTARIPAAWACRNCRQAGPDRRGAGSMPAACRISDTVDGATARPSFVSSPWIRRYPHSGFSFASRRTRRAMLWTVGGRPGLRRFLVSYFIAASLRCQASSVADVTGKISALRLRGMSRASAANHTRSAGSYRTRPTRQRSTAFWWRRLGGTAGAVSMLPASVSRDPPAAPGVRLSSHRALHASCPVVSRLARPAVPGSTGSGCCRRDSGSGSH